MLEYLYTAINPKGRKVTEYIEAESADTAVRFLGERGYSDIVLHTDDVRRRGAIVKCCVPRNQAASCNTPSTKGLPSRIKSNCSCPLSRRQLFWAACASLNIMARLVFLVPLPLVR